MNAPSFSRPIRRAAVLAAVIFVALVLLSGTPTGGNAAQARPIAATQKLSPALRDSFRAAPNARLRYLITLTDQADVENSIVDWNAKGQYVLDKLREVANKTQPPVAQRLTAQLKAGNISKFESYYIINAFGVTGNLASANALALLDAVQSIDVFPLVTLDSYAQGTAAPSAPNSVEWNVALVNAPQAWALGYNGAGVTVASLDTGVRYTHKTLVNHYRGKLANGTFDNNYNWWDSVRSLPAPYDGPNDGHGTHTMGTLVGDDGAGNQIGVAPGAKWIASNGVATGTDDQTGVDIIESAEFMLAPWDLNKQNANPSKRPVVVANSWGWGFSVLYPACANVEFLHAMIHAWRAAGIFPSFSGGNEYPQGNRPPAAYPDTFETGALRNPLLGVNSFASYSSQGPSCYDNGLLPQIMAGGGDAGGRIEDFVRSSWNTADDAYQYEGGTSMAQPATAGAVAILKQVNPNLTITQTWHILTSTTYFDPSWTSCGAQPNNCYGWGQLQIDAAVRSALQTLKTPTPTRTGTPPTATRTRTRTATPTGTLPTVTRTRTRTRTLTPRPTATASPTAACTLTYTSTEVPRPIVDMHTITSSLTISNGPIISAVAVISMMIDHANPGDMRAFLVSPAGTRVKLFNEACGSVAWTAANTGFTLSDRAGLNIGDSCPPYQSSYKPSDALSPFAGQSSSGKWTLEIYDSAASNEGLLDGWGLRIYGATCPGATATRSATRTATRTITPTRTVTRTATQTPTRTITPTRTAIRTATRTPALTGHTITITGTPPTATRTPTGTPPTATRIPPTPTGTPRTASTPRPATPIRPRAQSPGREP